MKSSYRFFLLLLFPICLFAQGSSIGSSQLKLPFTARTASLGAATIVDYHFLSSTYSNPANLFSHNSTSVMFAHTSWIQDINTALLAVRFPFFGTSMGFSIASNSIKGIEIRTQPGEPIGTFTARFALMGLSFAAPIGDNITMGFTVKYLYEKMYVDQAAGFAMDAGIIYKTKIPGLYAGGAFLDVGQISEFREQKRDLPSRFQLGARYDLNLQDITIRLFPAYVSELTTITSYFNVGSEFVYKNYLSLRFGYQSGYDARGFSAGAGVIYTSIAFDYAFIPFQYGLGNAHFATISIGL